MGAGEGLAHSEDVVIGFVRKSLMFGFMVLSACANPELEQKISDLDKRIAELEKRPAGPAGQQAPANPEEEQKAGELLQAANQAAEAGNYDEARTKIEELNSKFGETRAAKRAARLSGELAILGKDAGTLDVEKWFSGKTDFGQGKATFIVFWETWCPHCQREVPKMEETYAKYKGQGLNIVAVTKVTRQSTDEKVNEFIKEHKLSFPIGKEQNGSLSERFAVQGIPAAAVVKDGKVVWRGHPARVTDEMIQKWIL
jgi:thiol-disulfide isomerase/thioredoxin